MPPDVLGQLVDEMSRPGILHRAGQFRFMSAFGVHAGGNRSRPTVDRTTHLPVPRGLRPFRAFAARVNAHVAHPIATSPNIIQKSRIGPVNSARVGPSETLTVWSGGKGARDSGVGVSVPVSGIASVTVAL